MLKKPCTSVDCVTESLHNVGHGVQLKDPLKAVRYYVNIPQDRRCPLEQLQAYVDDLQQVPEEHHDGTGRIAKAQYQNKFTEDVIKELQPVYIGIIPVNAGNYH